MKETKQRERETKRKKIRKKQTKIVYNLSRHVRRKTVRKDLPSMVLPDLAWKQRIKLFQLISNQPDRKAWLNDQIIILIATSWAMVRLQKYRQVIHQSYYNSYYQALYYLILKKYISDCLGQYSQDGSSNNRTFKKKSLKNNQHLSKNQFQFFDSTEDQKIIPSFILIQVVFRQQHLAN